MYPNGLSLPTNIMSSYHTKMLRLSGCECEPLRARQSITGFVIRIPRWTVLDIFNNVRTSDWKGTTDKSTEEIQTPLYQTWCVLSSDHARRKNETNLKLAHVWFQTIGEGSLAARCWHSVSLFSPSSRRPQRGTVIMLSQDIRRIGTATACAL